MQPRNAKRELMRFRGSSPPDAADIAANVRWLRDRELIRDLYARYAYGVDSLDLDLVRSVFHPDCVVVGTMEEGTLDEYLVGMEEGLRMYDATMHFRGNQYVEIDGDVGFVETWVVGYHRRPPEVRSTASPSACGTRTTSPVQETTGRSFGERQWRSGTPGPSPVRFSGLRHIRARGMSRAPAANRAEPLGLLPPPRAAFARIAPSRRSAERALRGDVVDLDRERLRRGPAGSRLGRDQRHVRV